MPERFYQASTFLLFLFRTIGMSPPIVWTPRRTIQGWRTKVVEAFRNDNAEVFFSVLYLSFCVFVFSGGYEGAKPPHCLLRHFRNSGGNPPPTSFPKSLIGNPNAFKYCGPLIEAFRGDDLPHPSFPKFFIGNPRFCFFFGFKDCGLWTPA